jgi:hypothetical protein
MSTIPLEVINLADMAPSPAQVQPSPASPNGKDVGHNYSYARKALEDEIAQLRATDVGGRNNQLFKSAASLFELVAGGELDDYEVERELERAAQDVGLEQGETRATIRKGREAGMANPRYAPEKGYRPVPAIAPEGPQESPQNNSAETTSPLAERKRDIFWTALEVAEATPAQPPWVVAPWVVKGGLTELDGKIKGGKTTLALAMCRAKLDGLDFLGYPTLPGPVIYLTEQPQTSFREGLRRAGLLEREDFHILFFSDARGLMWPQRVGVALSKALEVAREEDTVLLVVDTLGWWAGLRGEAENDAGAAQEAVEPLLAIASAHPKRIGVMALRHERKSGGDVGDSARGSSAFGGSVDIVLSLGRPDGNTDPHLRVIRSLSRFDETPLELMVELTDEGYVAHGDVHAHSLALATDAAKNALREAKGVAMTLDELVKACDAQDVKRATMQRALDALQRQFVVKQQGAGKKGDPYSYLWVGFD